MFDATPTKCTYWRWNICLEKSFYLMSQRILSTLPHNSQGSTHLWQTTSGMHILILIRLLYSLSVNMVQKCEWRTEKWNFFPYILGVSYSSFSFFSCSHSFLLLPFNIFISFALLIMYFIFLKFLRYHYDPSNYFWKWQVQWKTSEWQVFMRSTILSNVYSDF